MGLSSIIPDDDDLMRQRPQMADLVPRAAPGSNELPVTSRVMPSLSNPAVAPAVPTMGAATHPPTEAVQPKTVGQPSGPLVPPIDPGAISRLWTKADNIHNPILRVLGKVGAGAARAAQTVGDIAAPSIAVNIPGTDLNAAAKRAQVIGSQVQQQKEDQAEASEKQTEANTANLESKPELAKEKQDEIDEKNKNQHEVGLRKFGLKTGPDGQTMPLEYADMSPIEQAATDLKNAQGESASAKSALDHIRADPNSPQNKVILERVQVMAKNAATAAGKLGLDKNKFVADYFGLDPQGNPLPGAAKDEAGKAVGPRIANSTNATAKRLDKSDLARNAQGNIAKMKKLITANPDLFGKVSGRFTSFEQMIGSDDPAIAQLGVEGHNLALSSNGVHGLRSAEAVAATEQQLLNHFRNSPKATIAALDANGESLQDFVDDAKLGKRAGGEAAAPQATHIYNPATGKAEPVGAQ